MRMPIRQIVIQFLSAVFCVVLLASCSDVNEDNSIYPYELREDVLLSDTCPRDEQENISTGAIVRMLFSKPLDPTTVRSDTILLGSGRYHVKGNLFYDDRVVTYVPTDALLPETRYDMYITSLVRDEDGFAITASTTIFSFTTGGESGETCR